MTCHVDGPLLYTNRTPYYRRSPTQKAPKSSPPRGWTGIAFSLSAATVVACELQQSCENDAIGTCERWDISRPVWRLALSTRGPSGAPHPAARPTAPGTDSAGAEIEAVLKAKLLPVYPVATRAHAFLRPETREEARRTSIVNGAGPFGYPRAGFGPFRVHPAPEHPRSGGVGTSRVWCHLISLRSITTAIAKPQAAQADTALCCGAPSGHAAQAHRDRAATRPARALCG
jgi:hypothetical protein